MGPRAKNHIHSSNENEKNALLCDLLLALDFGNWNLLFGHIRSDFYSRKEVLTIIIFDHTIKKSVEWKGYFLRMWVHFTSTVHNFNAVRKSRFGLRRVRLDFERRNEYWELSHPSDREVKSKWAVKMQKKCLLGTWVLRHNKSSLGVVVIVVWNSQFL